MYVYLYRFKSIEGYVNLCVKDFLLYHNYVTSRGKNRINAKVFDTLHLMMDKGFIQYIGCYLNGGLLEIDDVDCDMMFTVLVINYDEKWNPQNRFTKILFSEIDTLRKNRIKLMGKVLNLYVNIKKRISADTEGKTAVPFCFPSEKTLSRECGCAVNTIKNHTDILCDIGMLYMKNFGSYLRMYRGKEVVVNSNNVYALEEKYLDKSAREGLKSYLELNYGFMDGFYPFCNNLPNTSNGENIEDDYWGEPDSLENDIA